MFFGGQFFGGNFYGVAELPAAVSRGFRVKIRKRNQKDEQKQTDPQDDCAIALLLLAA